MLTLRFALFWTTLVVVGVAAGIVADVFNGATPQAAVDRLEWMFLASVTLGPISLMAVGQAAFAVVGIVGRMVGSPKRTSEAKAEAFKAFFNGPDAH